MRRKGSLKRLVELLFGASLGPTIKVLVVAAFCLLPLACLESYFGKAWLPKSLQDLISALPRESFYWLFGSIAQSLAALFGIGALFAAYLFQIADKTITDAYARARYLCGLDDVRGLTDNKLYAELTRLLEGPSPLGSKDPVIDELAAVKKEIDERKEYRDLFRYGFEINATLVINIIILSLLALPLTWVLVSSVAGIVFTLLLLVLVILSLRRMYQFINEVARQA